MVWNLIKGGKDDDKNFIKTYGKIKCCIGQGTTCKVYLHENNNGNLFAVKSFVKKNLNDTDEIKSIKREISIHEIVNDDFNVVKLIDSKRTKNNYLIILEFLPISLLNFYLSFKTFISINDRLCYFKQIVKSIDFLQLNNIGHRDLKLDNFGIDLNGNIKLMDFGSSTIGSIGYGIVGSPYYSAPEIHSNLKYDSFKCNLWSLGIILINLFYLSRQKWLVSRYDDKLFNIFKLNPLIENCVLNFNKIDLNDNYFKLQKLNIDKIILNLLTINVDNRMSLNDLINNSYFKNIECCKFGGKINYNHNHKYFIDLVIKKNKTLLLE